MLTSCLWEWLCMRWSPDVQNNFNLLLSLTLLKRSTTMQITTMTTTTTIMTTDGFFIIVLAADAVVHKNYSQVCTVVLGLWVFFAWLCQSGRTPENSGEHSLSCDWSNILLALSCSSRPHLWKKPPTSVRHMLMQRVICKRIVCVWWRLQFHLKCVLLGSKLLLFFLSEL